MVDSTEWWTQTQHVKIGGAIRSVAVALSMATAAACQSGTDPADSAGDCTAKLEFRGTTYSFHAEAATSPPTSSELGRADVIGCEDEVVDSAVVVKIDGVPVDIAVAGDEEWPGVYVAEDTDPASWPEPLKK